MVRILVILFLLTPWAWADSWEKANSAYEKGEYQAAQEAYEALAKAAPGSNVFYNLGNAWVRLDKKGDAILAYERALALEPDHPEARANLTLLQEQTGARLLEPSLYERALLYPEVVTGRRAAWLAAIGLWGFLFGMISRRGKRAPRLLLFLSLGVFLWAGASVGWRATRPPLWIVTAKQTEAKVAPAENSKVVSRLPTGSHLRLLLERSDWLYVILPDHTRGWIPKQGVEPVVPVSAAIVTPMN